MDDIYRNTSWDDEYSGYGVQIQQVSEWVGLQVEVGRGGANGISLSISQIIIEKSATAVARGQRHFNMRGSPVEGRDVWDVKKLLEVWKSRK